MTQATLQIVTWEEKEAFETGKLPVEYENDVILLSYSAHEANNGFNCIGHLH